MVVFKDVCFCFAFGLMLGLVIMLWLLISYFVGFTCWVGLLLVTFVLCS